MSLGNLGSSGLTDGWLESTLVRIAWTLWANSGVELEWEALCTCYRTSSQWRSDDLGRRHGGDSDVQTSGGWYMGENGMQTWQVGV